MKIKNYSIVVSCLIGLFFTSCKDLDEMNINPNGVDPASANASQLVSTVITRSGTQITDLGYGDIAGVMQYTQLDGWAGGQNTYDWESKDNNWSGFYENLRDAKELLRKADEEDSDFYRGVAKLFMAYNYGAVADLWGDAPFSEALKADEGIMKPKYDAQFDIYKGVLAYLEEANELLSKNQNAYGPINNIQDVLYAGNVSKWRKFANSLALRYYLRLSTKEPDFARQGITKILGDDEKYPLILDVADDAAFLYPANRKGTAWCGDDFETTDYGSWHRRKMCATLVEPMRANSDPRLGVFARKVDIPLRLDESNPDDYDQIEAGVRVIGKNVVANYETLHAAHGVKVNFNQDYIGMPPAWTDKDVIYSFNLNPPAGQGMVNVHCSQLNEIFGRPSGPLLKSRMLSAAEMHFCLAEIAWKGWGGDAKTHYEAGVRASLETWGVGSGYSAYIVRPDVAFDNTLKQIIEQKWIASWTAATEAWFDWRRTGYPELQPGKARVKRDAIPIRRYYGDNEVLYNTENIRDALGNFEETEFSATEPGDDVMRLNSAWSKMWLVQGTGKPW